MTIIFEYDATGIAFDGANMWVSHSVAGTVSKR